MAPTVKPASPVTREVLVRETKPTTKANRGFEWKGLRAGWSDATLPAGTKGLVVAAQTGPGAKHAAVEGWDWLYTKPGSSDSKAWMMVREGAAEIDPKGKAWVITEHADGSVEHREHTWRSTRGGPRKD